MASKTDSMRTVLDVVATIAIVLAAAAILWSTFGSRRDAEQPGRRAAVVPTEPISIEGIPIEGENTAPVVLVEFSDFECPFCARFAVETLPKLRKTFVESGQVAVAFRHAPIPSLHRRAQALAETAACAAEQGRFWQVHDAFFGGRDRLEEGDVRRYLGEARVDQARLDVCLKDRGPSIVRADKSIVSSLGLSGTPAFLIGLRMEDGARVHVTHVIEGAQPFGEFERVLRDTLALR